MVGRMPAIQRLIGTREAARILGQSERTVTRLVRTGDLTPAHIAPGGAHGAFLFDAIDVERLAAQRRAAENKVAS